MIICLLINKSLEDGVVPDVFKTAKVIPIYKSKNKELLANYRRISLLCSLSKLLDKIVHKRVYNFLQLHSKLCASQYGFRQKHSTVNAVLLLMNQTFCIYSTSSRFPDKDAKLQCFDALQC